METQLVSSLEIMLGTIMFTGVLLAGFGLWVATHQDKLS